MSAARLEGRSIVIVGGTSGLGLAAATACLREGARLTVVGRDDEHLVEAARAFGAEVAVIGGDAVDPGVTERAVRLAVERRGGLDGLFHVAGGSGRRFGDGPLDAMTDEGWRYTLDVNVTSMAYSNRAAVRAYLAAGRGGVVLNMASVLAFSPSPTHFATHAYAAAKAAAIGLTTSCASYYARYDIRFNVVAPALVATPGAVRALQRPEIADYVGRKQPLYGGRFAQPTDLDGAVVFLLSDESRFVTGQVLAVDGGWSVSEAEPQAGGVE